MKSLTELLSTPTTKLGRASRFLVFQIKLWSHCVRLLKRNRAGQQAAALAYYTIFGLVPLAIVVLLIFQSLPNSENLAERVKQFAYDQFHLNQIEYTQEVNGVEEIVRLTDRLDDILRGFFTGLDRKSLSVLSVVLVVWAASVLLSTIERAFNRIWHVSRGRGFLHRMISYWALLTLGPLLLSAGIYVTTQYAAFTLIEKTVLAHVAPYVLNYLLSVLGFFLLYFVLPGTKVKPGPALWGAAVAALVWSLAKFGFSAYVTEFIPYSKIYGVLGLIPLTIFWIHITWLIVLFGLQLTYTTQHLPTLEAAEIEARSPAKQDHFITNDLTVVNIAREIAQAFERNEGPVTSDALCSRLNLPPELGEDIVEHLVEEGLLVKTSAPRVGLVPARQPEHIRLSDLAGAVAAVAHGQPIPHEQPNLDKLVQAQQQLLARYTLKDMLSPVEPATPGLSDVPPGSASSASRNSEPPPDRSA
ncbi:MAG: YihY family inner membrane protein [Sedimentisphaerales bacterium]|nr:YihY family inner membrane protein [Sedimentisphaerales bacterium]